MTVPTDDELIERWRRTPAPLLGLLHAFHDRDGYLSPVALRAVAQALRIPLADLYGTVTFYHHFAREPGGLQAPRICTGPVCRLRGGSEILAALQEQGATPMPCAGRCDEPVPVLQGHQVLVGDSVDRLLHKPTALPAPNPGGFEECVFADIRRPGRNTLAGYQDTGGYEALTRAVTTMQPAEVVEFIRQSQLAGRGGAGFPTGLKWKAVAEA
ncbi:MAG: hypothetical protein DCC55_09145, partial [Chloroflexi bacterium]